MSRLGVREQLRRRTNNGRSIAATDRRGIQVELLERRLLLAVNSWAGDIPNGTIWGAGDIQRIDGNVHVPAGSTLTIQAGTVVKFTDFHTYSLTVDGTLNASGSAGSPVIFTTLRDDAAGGDTNGDGAGSPAYAGQWGGIVFTPSSTGNVLDHVEVRFAGEDNVPAVATSTGNLALSNSAIISSAAVGVRVIASNPAISNDTFQNNGGAAISMDLASNPAINAPIMSGNHVNGVLLDGGALPASNTWNDPNAVYVLSGNVTVPAGKTLTIAPGQVVKFVDFFSLSLTVNGTLSADGTGAQPITFTTWRDDAAGGDSNNDGTNSAAYGGQWQGLVFGSGSTGNVLDNVQIRYGGEDNVAALRMGSASLSLTASTIAASAGFGMRITASNPTISGTQFQDNTGGAISMDLASNPAITAPTFSNNRTNGVVLDGGTLQASNAWNDPEIVYVLSGNVTVPLGRTLTVAAGQIVKFADFFSLGLTIDGTLVASGSSGQPIIFTTWRDDAAGGDTNNDAANSAAYTGQWRSITLGAGSSGNILSHVQIRYGGEDNLPAVAANTNSLTMTDSVVSASAAAGLRIVASNPTIGSVTFQDNLGAAISMDLASNPTITTPAFSNNRTNGVLLDGGTLPASNAWDDVDVVYVLAGSVTVPAGKTLTVAPGQVVKFLDFSNLSLNISGTLNANGTGTQPIIFTTLRDDALGGDTNNDSANSAAYAGQWAGIVFNVGSTANVMNHAEVRYAGEGVVASVIINSSAVSMAGTAVRFSGTAGLRIVASNPTLAGMTFQQNLGPAVSKDLAADPAITAPIMQSNGINGLFVDGGTLTADVQWNDPDIVYWMGGTVSVPAGKHLTVSPGQVVKFAGFLSLGLAVSGSLIADGTAAQPIIFTTDRDDAAGGDTNNDAANSASYGGQWRGISLATGSTGHTFDHVEVRYAGEDVAAALLIGGIPLTISASVVRDSGTIGIDLAAGGNLSIDDSIVARNAGSGIHAAATSVVTAFNNTIDGNSVGVSADGGAVTLTNNLITNNSRSGIQLINGGTVSANYNDVFNPGSGFGNYEGMADRTGLNGNISADPKYVNRVAIQYDLLARSPAIDAGLSSGASATDLAGHARLDDPGVANSGAGAQPFYDMGALERQNVSDPVNLAFTASGADKSQVQIGDALTLHWTVQNNQVVSADGAWTDSVFASTDAVWDIDDTLVATVDHTGGLAPGASYNAQITLTVPPKPAGTLNFIIRTDSRHAILESVESDNDVAVSATLQVPSLVVGTPTNGQFTAAGQSRYYQITVAAGGTLLISLDSAAGSGANELYIRKADIPTATEFDARFDGGARPDQALVVPTTDAATYYLLVQNISGPPATYSLSAQFLPFSVRSVAPQLLGNAGTATVHVAGAQFVSDDNVTLVGGGATIQPMGVTFVDAANLYATFDLTGKSIGSYDVVVTKVQGATAMAPNAVQILAGSAGEADVQVIGPAALRRNRVVNYTLIIRNSGTQDAVLPLIFLDSHGAANLGFTPQDLTRTTLSVVPRPTTGPAGILAPGGSISITIFAQLVPSAQSPVRITASQVKYTNDPLSMTSLAAMFPGAALDQYLGSRAPEFHAHLNDILGATNADFVRNIHITAGQMAAQLPQGTQLSVEDVFATQFDMIDLLVENGLLDQYYLDHGITFGAGAQPAAAATMSGVESAGAQSTHTDAADLMASAQPPMAAEGRVPGSQADTSITTRYVGDPIVGVRKVRYISAGFIASQDPYDQAHWVSKMADLLHCIYPGDTIKVVNWNSGTMLGMGSFAVAGGAAGGAAGSVFPVIGTGVGAFTGFSSYAGAYYAGSARLTQFVGSDIAGDIRRTTTPENAVVYGHSLGAHIAGYTGRALNGQLGQIVAFDPAGELFGGVNDGLIPGAAQKTQGIFTSRSFGHLGTHLIYGRDPSTVTSERYFPDPGLFNIMTGAHAYSFEWYTQKLDAICKKIDAGQLPINTDPDLSDAPTTPNGNSNDPDPTNIGTSVVTSASGTATSTVVQSIDPNAMLGPAGFGGAGFLVPGADLPYTIEFENDPQHATAPAQEVTVTNSLDADMDWSTFELGTLGFGSTLVSVPPGRQSFSTTVDTTNQDGTALRVNIDASLNPVTGVVSATFRSVDPETGLLPADALAGFLPVNDSTHRGEGFVTYLIRAKSQLSTPTTITNQATIIFDDNAPLNTDAALNTIDATGPSSKVTALPAKSAPTFTLSWSGHDDTGGSGIASYDVFYSTDSGGYVPLLTGQTGTSAPFTGSVGHKYSFYSVATDNVGHTEAAPGAADSMATISADPVASLTAAGVTRAGGKSYVFSVKYIGQAAVNVKTIDAKDVVVTGPHKFKPAIVLVSKPKKNALQIVAKYQFVPPGGSWDAADKGTYTITLGAKQVKDTVGRSATGQKLGTFAVNSTGRASRKAPTSATQTPFAWAAPIRDEAGSRSLATTGRVGMFFISEAAEMDHRAILGIVPDGLADSLQGR